MNKFIGRIVTRLQGKDDGLIIGCCLNEELAPNTVYTISKCFLTGEITLKSVGESVVGSGLTGYNWAFEQQTLLNRLGQNFFLTTEEYIRHHKQGDLK